MITGKESGETAGANVLVVFYSRTGVTETQALAVGVGAIQARANIRLRRIRDAVDEKTISAHAKWVENRDRMNKEYVAPAAADAAWADAIILAAPYGFSASSSEVAGFLSLLRSLGPGGTLSKKIGGAFVSTSLMGDDDPGVASILSSFRISRNDGAAARAIHRTERGRDRRFNEILRRSTRQSWHRRRATVDSSHAKPPS